MTQVLTGVIGLVGVLAGVLVTRLFARADQSAMVRRERQQALRAAAGTLIDELWRLDWNIGLIQNPKASVDEQTEHLAQLVVFHSAAARLGLLLESDDAPINTMVELMLLTVMTLPRPMAPGPTTMPMLRSAVTERFAAWLQREQSAAQTLQAWRDFEKQWTAGLEAAAQAWNSRDRGGIGGR